MRWEKFSTWIGKNKISREAEQGKCGSRNTECERTEQKEGAQEQTMYKDTASYFVALHVD